MNPIPSRSVVRGLLAAVLGVAVGACGADGTVAPTSSPAPSATSPGPSATAQPAATPEVGPVLPAPNGGGSIYPPNPEAIVVAIEAGHGGCLDWGVPDPRERGEAFAEKAITLGIARAVADRLAAEGLSPLLVRGGDEALAGDHYPELGCEGEPFRDVNGDREAGFGEDVSEATRTRDELQARLDRANLAAADVLVSIHVDSITDAAGTPLPIARTETFYTDETPWGVPVTEPLAAAVQRSLVDAMAAAADYDRQDRGISAHNLYIVAPPLVEPTPDRPDPRRQPTRGALMPALLVEVGSITRPEEHELLLSDGGVRAAAVGIVDGLAAWLSDRGVAGRIALDGSSPGTPPEPVPGEGPPFVAAPAPEGSLRLRVTNTGTVRWRAGTRVVAATLDDEDAPYVYGTPTDARAVGPELPALAPGESVVLVLDGQGQGGEGLAWFSLLVDGATIADRGSPALQLRTGAP